MPKKPDQKIDDADSASSTLKEFFTVPINKTKSAFTPESQSFTDHDNLLPQLGYAIKENLPVLLIGETGTGKTSAIRYLASQTNNAFRRLNLNGSTTVDEFVGKILINKDGTYWVDGILIDAMRNGHWLLLDEINAALPEVLFVLQSLLDDDKMVVISDKEDKEVVRPHKNFRLFASMNPAENYVGTKELNKALMSRFPMVIEVKYPTPELEQQIIENRFPSVPKKDIELIVEFANQLRETHKAQEIDFICSTRDLLNWCKVNEHFNDWGKSAGVTLLSKCNEHDAESLKSLLRINFATNDFKLSELTVGQTLMVTSDLEIFNREDCFIAEKTVVRIDNTFQLRQNLNLSVGTLAVLEVPKKVVGDNRYAQVGNRWSVTEKGAEGKLTIKANRK